MIEFPYQPELISGPRPPSLHGRSKNRWRPSLALRLTAPSGRRRYFPRMEIDTGSADTIFPWTAATLLGVQLLPNSKFHVRWHGTPYPLRFANMTLEIAGVAASCRWQATVAFSSAPIPYALFGIAGGLEYFDATFRGEDHLVELTPTAVFPAQPACGHKR